MGRKVRAAAGAAVLALIGLAIVGGTRMRALHRRIAKSWAPVEMSHRVRAELVPQLEDMVSRVGAQSIARLTPVSASLPPVSGTALLDDPASFGQWDEAQRDLFARMMESCQMVVGSPELEHDPEARGLLDRLAASERRGRAAQAAFEEAVTAYGHAREGWVGGSLAIVMGLSRRDLKISGAAIWASPDLMARCPLVN